MLMSHDQQLIHQVKTAILSGNAPLPDDVKKCDITILDSWQRSLSKGLDYSCIALPSSAIDYSTKERLTDIMLYEFRNQESYYFTKHNFLSNLGIAVYYLDSKKCVVSNGGYLPLLLELKKIGLKFGTNFSEDAIGTNADALLRQDQSISCVIGEEHYMNALLPYVTVATSLRNKYIIMDQVLIFPVENYNERYITIMQLMYYLELYHSIAFSKTFIFSRDKVVDLALKSSQSYMLLVDAKGVILDSSTTLSRAFQISASEIVGKRLDSVFPELKEAMNSLKTERIITMSEVSFRCRPFGSGEYYMDCTPIKSDNNYIGVAIALTNKNKYSMQSSGTVNANARYCFPDIIGENKEFKNLKNKAIIAAQSPSNILIYGESGTGKELFSQAIHNASPSKSGPFIALNCAALPQQLVGSELFGYEEGAFTGAKKGGSPGKFELANGGTLFLDEVSEMPLDMQSMLLRVLEEGKITRLGGSKGKSISVRILAATNRNMADYIQQGKFRMDLYYRLNVIKLNLIPLRMRKDDIPVLVDYFLRQSSSSFQKGPFYISPQAMQILIQYDWPGNTRELRNVIEAAINMAQSNMITASDLPSDITESCQPDSEKSTWLQSGTNVPEPVQEIPPAFPDFMNYDSYEAHERDMIKYLMYKHSGNKTLVAKELGVARSTLYRKLKADI